MLILVAVTISMAVNGGVFDYAGKATSETQNAIDAEQDLASGKVTIGETTYNSIDEYLGTSGGNGTGDTMLPYDQTAKDENGLLTENATYVSGGYTALIPKGFAIVPGVNGTTTIADGLVITDELDENGNSIGNEFVWIPVEVTSSDTETSIASFYRSTWSNNARGTIKYTGTSGTSYNEPLSSGGYTNEAAEYNEMLKSVYENGGFYIGRYEAGSTTERTYAANGTTEMVVKRDVYPYTYVGWGLTMSDYTSGVIDENDLDQGKGALALSKAMYENKDVGVTSTLCYGIQWDAMLDFIKDADHNVSTSTTWGNYSNNSLAITRTTAKYLAYGQWNAVSGSGYPKTEPTLLTTGADDSFVAKNIFDVAGNVFEWTNEASSTYYRVCRGGFYSDSDDFNDKASYRNIDYPYGCYDRTGFRVVLYIK